MKRFIWNTYLESLDKKYSMYYINKQYKETSFKNEEEYTKVQINLSHEIELLNTEIFEAIKSIIYETYPDLNILAYDSISFSKSDGFIGKVLTKGLKSASETLDVKACFERFADVKIQIDRIEDCPDDVKAELEKNLM